MTEHDRSRDLSALIERYAESELPTARGNERIVVYHARDVDGTAAGPADHRIEHVAVVVGTWPPAFPVLARVHSECFSGEVLGSLKCECGPQLGLALDRIHGSGSGVLVYLRQEGRGIGLGNKIRAYALQERGVDTVDANTRLGHPADARDYRIAAAILQDLGIQRVRLMTNNPKKVESLEQLGIEVTQRLPHQVPGNQYNEGYLETKKRRLGHLL